MSQARAPRLTLTMIAAAFLTPFVLAVALRFGGWQPIKTRNYGVLLDPPLSMAEVEARVPPDDRVWVFANTEHTWTLLARVPARCGEACRSQLALLPNVRVALGRHARRLHAFLLDGTDVDSSLPRMKLAGDLPKPLAASSAVGLEVWLVDPHGYLVLHYPEGFDLNGLRRDLSRLIK